jgi:hypothetical protein
VLDLVEETLDQIARSIEIRAKADWLVVVIAFWRDVCPSAALSDESSDPIGVNSTISEQHRSRFQVGQQREDKTVVMRLAWSARHEQVAHWYRRPRESWSSIRLATGPSVVHCRSDAGSMLMHAHNGCINLCTAASWPAVNAFIS